MYKCRYKGLVYACFFIVNVPIGVQDDISDKYSLYILVAFGS